MNKKTKIIISIISIILSIFFYFIKKKYLGSIFLINTLLITFLIFKNEFLIIAFLNAKKGNVKGIKKYIKYIKNPDLQLLNNEKGYYYFLKGISNSDNNIKKTEKNLNKAIKLGLKIKYNEAIAKLNLAIIAASKGDKKKAKILLENARKIDKSGIIKDQIKEIKKNIQKINISKKNIQNPYNRKKHKIN